MVSKFTFELINESGSANAKALVYLKLLGLSNGYLIVLNFYYLIISAELDDFSKVKSKM